MTHSTDGAAAHRSDSDYIVLDAVAYVHGVWKHKWSLLAFPVTLAVAFFALSYLRPKTYQSTVVFMPPKQAASSLLMFSRPSSSGDEYRAELGSRSVGLDVVRRLDMVKRLKMPNEDLALRVTRGMVKFGADVNNFITITAISGDPQLSSDVANGYYKSLENFTETLAAHEAEHRLNYLDGPLRVEHQRLEIAENELAQIQQKTGLVVPTAQASLGVQAVASMRARVSDLQAQMATLLTSSTRENPRVVSLSSEIGNLQGQIQRLESKNEQSNSPANLPKLGLEVNRKQREVELHTQTMEALTRALGTTQTVDSYTPSLSLIDAAIPAKEKYSPSRRQWAMVGFALGLFFALARIVVLTAYREWSGSQRGTQVRSRWRASWQERTLRSGGHAN